MSDTRCVDSLLAQIEKLQAENKALKELAFTDKLTGLSNRAKFEIDLETTWNLAIRQNQDISIAFIDVDHFKKINDTLGHDAGDRVFQALGNLMLNCFRCSDIPCRIGGDEFAVIMPNTDLEGAYKALKILSTVFTQSTGYTLSIGVSCCNPNSNDCRLEFLKRADIKMYEAKSSGRNSIKM